jgi:glycine/D-amino acid oxidase-like deaminating enzyme
MDSVNHPQDRPGTWDAIVVGGGFFGCSIAITLKEDYGLDKVLVVERESELMARASYANQARVHNGYHYPRSFTTAFRSRVNFPRFVARYRGCIADDFTMLYCIAAQNSLVTKYQFEKFCSEIGAELRPADESLQGLFNPALVDAVYEAVEYAFDATALADIIRRDMEAARVSLLLEADVRDVASAEDGLVVSVRAADQAHEMRSARVFNCTYAGLNSLSPGTRAVRAKLKYEISEIALVIVPEPMAGLGVTVMDGPFFSCMPFPATGQHSLTHVRYTPHFAWLDTGEAFAHPYDVLEAKAPKSRARYMIGDAARYMPIMREVRHDRSLFEVKTVLLTNEVDDGRPILFEPHEDLRGMYSILGGKIDNIFDIKDAMRDVL